MKPRSCKRSLNRRETKTGNSSETENRVKFTSDAKIKSTLLRFHPVKRLELENQQPFLVKKMAPKRKATIQTNRNNKVWTEDETNKYADTLCGTENGDQSWLY